MRSQDSRGGSGRRQGRGQRRSSSRASKDRSESRTAQQPPARKSFWQKILGFFQPEAKAGGGSPRPAYPKYNGGNGGGSRTETRPARKPESVEVTTPKLYIGNLSYEATENDLLELFNGVGMVRSAEVATHRDTYKSKGFGFVTMSTVDEAKRAVTELHDKDFMGRKLIVNGARSGERETDYRG